MAIRNILNASEPRLHKKSRLVTEYNERLHELIDDMRETLLKSGGVGLAAPQVGVLRRVVLVMDTNREDLTDDEQIIEMVNPEIIETDGEQTGYEGCLSLPDLYGIVTRPEYVKVRAFDRFGNEFTVDGHGLTARAFCHETDHLEGKIFSELTDKLLSSEDIDAIEAMKEEEKSGKA
jgi:peptide deformylase